MGGWRIQARRKLSELKRPIRGLHLHADCERERVLRREVALVAWVRAVLLENWGLANRLTIEAAKVAPETAVSMEEFRAADGQFRVLVAKLVLL